MTEDTTKQDVYVSIGNSDDKLTQTQWHSYWTDTDDAIARFASHTYGVWMSLPTSEYQNCCWAFQIDRRNIEGLNRTLSLLAAKYRQESIAWAEAQTVLLAPADEGDATRAVVNGVAQP